MLLFVTGNKRVYCIIYSMTCSVKTELFVQLCFCWYPHSDTLCYTLVPIVGVQFISNRMVTLKITESQEQFTVLLQLMANLI